MGTQAVYLIMICCLFVNQLAFSRGTGKSSIQLQIVSEVYKKQPYIIVPTARIDAVLANKILAQLQKCVGPEWQAQMMPLQGEWAQKLKCWPAVNIEFFPKEPSTSSKSAGMLLIYPRNYRGIIEDPLADNPPPISYLGSTRRLAFYFYPNQQAKSLLAQRIATMLGSLGEIGQE